ncbi:MAG: efflux RND transporter periplasmic adaptor subunit [Lachnospiraceae bacterium]|nr:efflux RND transporter periplasmic adaptor subunit [Lachnospiraceae bacterium]
MRHWKWIAGACIVLGVAAGGLSVKASAKTAVQTAVAERGRLDCKLELNGKVESLRGKTYFAGIPGRIGSVMVREGDFVKKGDLLITYDEGELSKDLALTELDAAADMGRYDDSAQAGERMEELCGEAGRSIAELDRQINDTEVVLMLNRKLLTERQGGFAARDAALQADLACCTGGEDEDPEDVREKRDNIQKEIAKNQYDLQYDPEILEKQENIRYLEYLMANLREKRAVMESQRSSAQMNLETQGEKDRNEAVRAADDLENESRRKDLEMASSGIRAEVDGVVTKLSVLEGSGVERGQELIRIQSLSDAAVVCHVNKYDIIDMEEGQAATAHIKNKDYSCHVSRIEKKTTDDGAAPGIRVECRIDEPDEQIILGIESKINVVTANVLAALLIPTDALYSEDGKDSVFVLEEGKAVRREVAAGVRNDDSTEILEGLREGDMVCWDESGELTEGQNVKGK